MKISVIIPTLDEGAVLTGTLARAVEACRSREREIIVVDGGSRDGTLEAARGLADRVLPAATPGRASQMHAGAEAACGELLLFLHADTRLPDGWDEILRKAFSARPPPAAAAFRLGYDSPRVFYRLLSAMAYFRSRASGVPHGDQAIAVRRETYFESGGFPPVPLMEEYYLIPKLRRAGPVVILPQRVETSVRRYEQRGPLLNAMLNSLLVGLHYLGVPPGRLAALYKTPAKRPAAPAGEGPA